MTFRPNQFAIFILNEDGSGTVLQYDNYQDAKADFWAVVDAGTTAWLYPFPSGSITQENKVGFTPPASNASPVFFTAEQNENSPQNQENPQVDTEYDYEVVYVSETGINEPSGTRSRAVYRDGTRGQWTPWSWTPEGTAYTTQVIESQYDAGCGPFTYLTATQGVYANGNGGYYLANYSPNYITGGTVLQECNGVQYIADGLGNYTTQQPCQGAGQYLSSGSGTVYMDFGCGGFPIGTSYYDTFTDGNCGSYSTETSVSYYPDGTVLGDCNGYRYTSNGSGGYNTESLCPASGALVNQGGNDMTYDAGCGVWTYGSRTWEEYTDGSCGTYIVDNYTWYSAGDLGSCNGYIYSHDGAGNITSQQDCPAADTILNSGSNDLYCDVGCGNSVYGYYAFTEYADGSCGSYTSGGSTYYVGDFVECNGYIYSVDADGVISSREAPPPCPPSGNWVSDDSRGETYDAGCGDWIVGTTYYSTYTDGNCGFYSMDTSTSWYPDGTFLGACADYNYYSNGLGGTYSEYTGGCPGEGTLLNGGSDDAILSTSCFSYTLGYTPWTDYADGFCGSYRSYGSFVPNYEAGYYFGECDGTNYWSDGGSGYYT